MSVSNGQLANQTTFNNAFWSRTTETSTTEGATIAKHLKRSVGDAISAFAGGGQGSATLLSKDINIVSTVASSADSVKLPVAVVGMEIHVFNISANTLAVFPNTGATIDGGSANASVSIAAGGDYKFVCKALLTWETAKSMPAPGTNNYVLTADSTQPGGVKWAAGGGGGGGSLQWVEGENAPVAEVSAYYDQVYTYTAGLGQAIYALIRVPTSYTAGNQINLKMPWYSADSSGNVLMQTVATLIRNTTDAISSTTNQRTSTNSAVTLGAGTVNEPQGTTYDLTSSSGQINSVAVAAGDLIRVKFLRGTDTATGDVFALVYATEVTFT